MRPMSLGCALVMIAASSAVPQTTGVYHYEYDPGTGLLPMPVQVALAALERCGTVGVEYLGFNLTLAAFGSGNNSASGDVEFNTQDAFDAAVSGILGQFPTPGITVQPCPPFRGDRPILEIRGSVSLYSFHIGSGGYFRQMITGTISATDTVTITSVSATTVEVPLHISGGVTAAESFGAQPTTTARGKLRLATTFGGTSYGPYEIEVFSDSVIPNMGSINQSAMVTIPVSPGTTTVSFGVSGSYEAEAGAQGFGLFGSIAGASTVIVDFPNSIRAGNFRGVGGAPLPPGLRIQSTVDNKVYLDTDERLAGDQTSLSLQQGGTQVLTLSPGPGFAGQTYWVAGTTAGVSPGLTVGSVLVPLNPDPLGYFAFTVTQPNTPILTNSLGSLDASGVATTTFNLPTGLPASLAGLTAHHSVLVLDAATFSPLLGSNPVPVQLLP